MADSSQVRRILYMHPAHRTVGVSGVASSFRLCPPIARPSADEPAVAPAASFARVMCGRQTKRCGDGGLSANPRGERALGVTAWTWQASKRQGLATPTVRSCLAGASRSSAAGRSLTPTSSGKNGVEEDEGFEVEVEVAAAARWHPVVDGVGPFIARHRFSHSTYPCHNVTQLLVRKWAGRVVSGSLGTTGRRPGVLHVVGSSRRLPPPRVPATVAERDQMDETGG